MVPQNVDRQLCVAHREPNDVVDDMNRDGERDVPRLVVGTYRNGCHLSVRRPESANSDGLTDANDSRAFQSACRMVARRMKSAADARTLSSHVGVWSLTTQPPLASTSRLTSTDDTTASCPICACQIGRYALDACDERGGDDHHRREETERPCGAGGGPQDSGDATGGKVAETLHRGQQTERRTA